MRVNSVFAVKIPNIGFGCSQTEIKDRKQSSIEGRRRRRPNKCRRTKCQNQFESERIDCNQTRATELLGNRRVKRTELTIVVFVIRFVCLGNVAFADVVLVVPYRRGRRVQFASLARRAVAGVIVARLRKVQHGAVTVGRGSRRSIPHLVQLVAGALVFTPFVT